MFLVMLQEISEFFTHLGSLTAKLLFSNYVAEVKFSENEPVKHSEIIPFVHNGN